MPSDDKEEFYNRALSRLIAFKGGKQKGLIGLEIEVEGKALFTAPFKYWVCHNDGSLRETDGHPPQEYVLKEPLSYDEVTNALRYLEGKLKEAGSSVVLSNRTSVHVHINCQDMTLKELYCYVLFYLIFEEVLVDWAGPERAGNLFCLRAKDSQYYIEMLESVLKKGSFKDWREDVRYAACNVASIPKFGSLEFRALRGTVDINLIQTWIKILLVLKDKAAEYESPIDIVEDFNQLGPLPFFRQTFAREEVIRNALGSTSNLSAKLWDGLRMMRDVAYCIDPWKKSLPKKSTEEESQVNNQQLVVMDIIQTPWGPKDIRRKTSGGNWRIRDYDRETYQVGLPYYYTVPSGQEMLYFMDENTFLHEFIRLETREII